MNWKYEAMNYTRYIQQIKKWIAFGKVIISNCFRV